MMLGSTIIRIRFEHLNIIMLCLATQGSMATTTNEKSTSGLFQSHSYIIFG